MAELGAGPIEQQRPSDLRRRGHGLVGSLRWHALDILTRWNTRHAGLDRSALLNTTAAASVDRLIVLNPPPDVGGGYPKAMIESVVPWWGAFLAKARPGEQHNQAAAKLLARIFTNALVYVRNAYAAGALSGLLKLTPGTQSRFVNE